MEFALEFDRIEKRYRDFRLQPTSFAVPRGYVMGLIGPNGAGKTTLIKLALNLIRRDGGVVRLFEKDNLQHERETRARIGFVPDEPRFHEDIALQRLKQATARFYPTWNDVRFHELAEKFELPLGRKFKKLSHGMKSKFALAMALAHEPELLILDEPTAGLDPAFRRELLGLLSGSLQDASVSILFSTHITSDLERVADYITYVQEGRVVFSKSKDDVLDTYVVVKGGRELLDGQSRDLFEGVRLNRYGFEALTAQPDEVRRRFGDAVTTERASLDDVMVLMQGRLDHAA
ncbi:MAG: ABC transporter ATP-binding protein [bacterium]|nr:ABC transporter ATP-binding protein [bacterium]